jgi:PPOX class probable F420-dependent enzyme
MNKIPETHLDLLADERKAFLFLATIMPSGSPQVTPIWFNVENDQIQLNSAAGRIKDRNMRARPQVALCIPDPANPYRYLQIQGKVIEITTADADDHINRLTMKYRGLPIYPYRQPEEQRVKYKIQIDRVDAHG